MIVVAVIVVMITVVVVVTGRGGAQGRRRRDRAEQRLAGELGAGPGRVEARGGDGDLGDPRVRFELPQQGRALAVPPHRERDRAQLGRRVAHVDRLAEPRDRHVGQQRQADRHGGGGVAGIEPGVHLAHEQSPHEP
jgi:hypothetical protein